MSDETRSPQSLTDDSEPAIRYADQRVDFDCNLQAPIIEVKCGQLTARMHMDKFICPGIHQICIEVEDHLITPKEFTIRANKDKQKDWKGSIRIGKSNLRALMEMKALDFFQHDVYCSAKCQSRNYLTANKGDSVDCVSTEGAARKSPPGPSVAQQISPVHPMLSLGIPLMMKAESRVDSPPTGAVTVVNDAYETISLTPPSTQSHSNFDNMKKMLTAEPMQFWTNMHQLGIFDDLVGEIAQNVEQLKVRYATKPEIRSSIAQKLSSLVDVLNLFDKIGDRLHSKRMQTVFESNVLTSELQELQRKAEERKRKQEDAKRKSDLFDQLFAASSAEDSHDLSAPSAKIARPS
uniref:SAND domain-containing protein n=1 Tax=Plectus sambesii TaxID=2011161 RepID=A0A914XLL1_9BILA